MLGYKSTAFRDRTSITKQNRLRCDSKAFNGFAYLSIEYALYQRMSEFLRVFNISNTMLT